MDASREINVYLLLSLTIKIPLLMGLRENTENRQNEKPAIWKMNALKLFKENVKIFKYDQNFKFSNWKLTNPRYK